MGAQTAHSRGHGIATGRGGEDYSGAAEFQKFRRGVLRLAVDVARCAQLFGQRLFVLAAGDANGRVAHFRGELNAEMSKPAQAKYGHELPGPGAAVAQGVESCDAGAHQGSRLYRG